MVVGFVLIDLCKHLLFIYSLFPPSCPCLSIYLLMMIEQHTYFIIIIYYNFYDSHILKTCNDESRVANVKRIY